METFFIVWRQFKRYRRLDDTHPIVTKEKSFATEKKRQAFMDRLQSNELFIDVLDWRTEIS